MKILHICRGLYNFWTTYEGEYLNESLMAIPEVDLKIWGNDRIYPCKNINFDSMIESVYGSDYPDVIIVHASMEKHDDPVDFSVFNGLENAHRKSIVIWRTFDCFDKNLSFYCNQIEKYKPQIVLNWYLSDCDAIRSKVFKDCRVIHFPHSVGRRYINKMYDRQYDIALIGRCINEGKTVTADLLPKLKVYMPPKRSSRSEKGSNLIDDLNKCKFSWNSPVQGRVAGLRFFEAPACGTISMVPEYFSDLDQYFPKDCYCVCGSSFKKSINIIKSMNVDQYLLMQQKAYKIVINNHSMDKRVSFLLDVIKGKNCCFHDFNGINI